MKPALTQRATLPRPAWTGPAGRLRAAWVAATGTGAAASLALAVLVAVCAFVAIAVPRSSLGYRTQVLQRMFRATASAQKSVLADADVTGLTQTYLSKANLVSSQAELAAGLRRDQVPLAPPATQWSGLATGSKEFSVAGQRVSPALAPPQMELVYRTGLAANARLVAGSLPRSAVTNGTSGTFQVAVTQATAAKFGLRPGSLVHSNGQVLAVTGIIRPLRAASSFWTVDPVAAAPLLTYPSINSPPYWDCGAFVGDSELGAMQAGLKDRSLHAVWSFPLALGHVTADQAAGLQQTLQAVTYLSAASAVSTSLTNTTGQTTAIAISLSSGLATALQPFVATDDAVQRVLSLLFVSLAVIAAVVALLGARLVAEHRRDELAMMRARGASLRQVAAVALRGSIAAVLPAAAAAGAIVAATPGPVPWLSWWLAGLIIVAALVSPPLLAAWWYRPRRTHRSPAAMGASAAAARRRIVSARRWVTDAGLACAAAAGVIVLRQQGLPPAGHIDLFTSAAPVLAAVPVALLIMRVYPVVLRWLTRLARRRRGVVLVVGFARGSAAVRAGVLPAFALVLAFAMIAFAAMARGAVARADVAASWQAAGADAVVTAPAAGPGITPAAQHLITRVAGVRRFAALTVTTGTSSQGQSLPAVIVDPRQYAALVAATPEPAFPAAKLAGPPAGGRVPVLVSPGTTLGGSLYVAGHQLPVRVAGTVPGITGASPGDQFTVVPRWALGKQSPAVTALALVGPSLDTQGLTRTVRRAVPGAQTTLRTSLLAAIADTPLPHGGVVTFGQGIAAAAAFSLLILVLMLVLSARSRELTLARLDTMGLGQAQSRRITAAETLPAILAAAVGGTACTLALVPLVAPAINLAAFTGVPVTVPLHANLTAIAATAAGLLLLAGLTLTMQDRLARRRGTAQALRAGE